MTCCVAGKCSTCRDTAMGLARRAEYARALRLKNLESCRQRDRDWYRRNAERLRQQDRERRAKRSQLIRCTPTVSRCRTGECRSCLQYGLGAAQRQARIEKKAAYDRRYREQKRLKIKAYQRAHYQNNRERIIRKACQWAQLHPQQRASYLKSYSAQNAERVKLHSKVSSAKRRATKLDATPRWLTKDHRREMRTIYSSCPKGYHVDHIVPLVSSIVCGLHVPWNLQILPARENLTKGNKLLSGLP